MEISVIIPTYDKPSRLTLTLQSLAEQKFPKDEYEVVLVDDESHYYTEEIYHHFSNKMHIKYKRISHSGRSIARNEAIDLAEGRILVFTDDDAILSMTFLNQHWENHNKFKNAVILGQRQKLYCTESEILKFAVQKEDYYQLINHKKTRIDSYEKITRQIFEENKKCCYSIPWICAITSNMSVQRQYVMSVDKFNVNFVGWGFEDIDLGYKLYHANQDFYYDKTILNYHLEHQRNVNKMKDDIKKNVRYFYNLYHDDDIKEYWKFYKGEIGIRQLMLNTQKKDESVAFEKMDDTKLQFFSNFFNDINL